MRVGKLGHASVVVWDGSLCCLMDPVFIDPFEGGANAMDPAVTIDIAAATKSCDVVVLSHAHMDHFCVRSLARFPREVPVLFPASDALIERALARLGFERRQPVGVGDKISLGDLTLFPTASRADFPEIGMLFRGARRSFWNMVDSVVDDGAVDIVRSLVGTPDLVFAKFQPLLENELIVNALGSDFPVAKYGVLLRNVWNVKPRLVAPSSCGYRYARARWLNDRGFPITDAQFEADLREGDPSLRVIHVPHGGAVDLDGPAADVVVDPAGVPFAKRREGSLVPAFDWRPERGVPPLSDENPRAEDAAKLRRRVDEWLGGEFLSLLAASPDAWLERMARQKVQWRLEVVHPSGPSDVRRLDFGALSRGWVPAEDATFYKLHTSICASAIVGLLDGQQNSYSLTFNDVRIMERLYAVGREGLTRFGSIADEPMMRILCDGADDRFIERELGMILANDPKDA